MPGPADAPFQYALLRVVPRIERGEAINAGVVLFARTRKYLDARVRLDTERLRVIAPDADVETIQKHLDARARIAAGAPDGGPIAQLDQSERFNWLVAPSSTVIQPSAVHTGLCPDPESTLQRLFERLVL